VGRWWLCGSGARLFFQCFVAWQELP
jgi:hypothetical protein